jgi:hypothetical protein
MTTIGWLTLFKEISLLRELYETREHTSVKTQLLNIKTDGTYNYHGALKGYRDIVAHIVDWIKTAWQTQVTVNERLAGLIQYLSAVSRTVVSVHVTEPDAAGRLTHDWRRCRLSWVRFSEYRVRHTGFVVLFSYLDEVHRRMSTSAFIWFPILNHYRLQFLLHVTLFVKYVSRTS